MAREWALAGVDRSELTPPPPPEKPKTLKAKWDNFWYHYRVVFWIVMTVLVIASWVVVKTVTDDPADYEIVAVTEMVLYPTELEALQTYLASVGNDIDGDGKVEVHIENLVPNFNADGTSAIGLADQQKLVNYIAAGEKMLFIFSPACYDEFGKSIAEVTSDDYEFFAPLNVIAAVYNAEEHYVALDNDAVFADAAPYFDMVIGVRTPEGTAGNREAVMLYEQGKALVEALANK